LGDSVWVLTQQGVLPLIPNSSQFAPFVGLGGIPGRAIPAMGSLWILLPKTGSVVRFDMDSSEIARKIPVGQDPELLIFAAMKIWIANKGDSTITPILPDNSTLPVVPLLAAPVALINVGGAPFVATADGSVLKLDATGSGEPSVIAHVSQGQTHLTLTDDYVWAWQEGDSTLWRIDPTGGAQQQSLPFAVEKLTAFGGFLWVVAADGHIAKIDASNALIHRSWSPIEDEPLLFAKVEARGHMLLLAADGTVYKLRP